MRRTVHIDGDILVYSVGFAAEKGEYTITWQPDGVEEVSHTVTYKKEVSTFVETLGRKPYVVEYQRHPEPVENALHSLKKSLESIITETEADDHILYLSGPTNFRNALGTIRVYKGNRDVSHKPVHGPAIREYMAKYHPTVISDNEEADDVIGYTHYAQHLTDPESTIIATQDKDLNMIPGYHYNMRSGDLFFIDDDEADFNFYRQLLTGDSTDNVVGVPGLGPRKAEKLLRPGYGDVSSMYDICAAAYAHNDKILLENARLLWIRRNKGEMWSPPTGDTTSSPQISSLT